MRRILALLAALSVIALPVRAASPTIVAALSSCDGSFFSKFDVAKQAGEWHPDLLGRSYTFSRPISDGRLKLTQYLDERSTLFGATLLSWGFLVHGKASEIAKVISAEIPQGRRIKPHNGGYGYMDIWALKWMPEKNDALAGKVAFFAERGFIVEQDSDANGKPTDLVRIYCTLQGQHVSESMIAQARPDIKDRRPYLTAPAPDTSRQGAPVQAAVIDVLTRCDDAFFRQLFTQRDLFGQVSDLAINGTAASFATYNHNLFQNGSHVIFKRPIDDGGVKLAGYVDDRMALVGQTSFDWGFIVQGKLDDVIKNVQPLIKSGTLKAKTQDDITAYSLDLDGNKRQVTVMQDIGDYSDFVRVQCSLQGPGNADALRAIRPDIADPTNPTE